MSSASKKILLVEDSDTTRLTHRVMIAKRTGYTVITVANGREALKLAESEKPDLVLMDVMMPGMDGPTTFRELRKNPVTAKIPVLFLTAKVQATDRRRFADLGIHAVLVKPFDPLTLATQIASALGWK